MTTATTGAAVPGEGRPQGSFAEYRRSGSRSLRNQLVNEHLGLARFLARRFQRGGESLEDLEQVAYLGLVLAIDRFDPERGVEFATFAVPTILGELKRHLRDRAWAVRVPRRVKELHLATSAARERLQHTLGRAPTVEELAVELGTSDEDVLQALEAARGYRASSIDATSGADDDGETSLAARLGDDDARYDAVEDVTTAAPVLAGLGERDQLILRLRFFHDMTQAEIAARLGVSQVHVSRLLAAILADVRRQVGAR
ncbi:MAG TPA: SigB/SigF/SigG family RNA polymerase sigma factor [Acidimicrobiales bacterium]